jgi:hypothetical protein
VGDGPWPVVAMVDQSHGVQVQPSVSQLLGIV